MVENSSRPGCISTSLFIHQFNQTENIRGLDRSINFVAFADCSEAIPFHYTTVMAN